MIAIPIKIWAVIMALLGGLVMTAIVHHEREAAHQQAPTIVVAPSLPPSDTERPFTEAEKRQIDGAVTLSPYQKKKRIAIP